jgi:hypothetical protein
VTLTKRPDQRILMFKQAGGNHHVPQTPKGKR